MQVLRLGVADEVVVGGQLGLAGRIGRLCALGVQSLPDALFGMRDGYVDRPGPGARAVAHCEVARATPFGFALMVERFREKLTTEKLSDRVSRMLRELEKAAIP